MQNKAFPSNRLGAPRKLISISLILKGWHFHALDKFNLLFKKVKLVESWSIFVIETGCRQNAMKVDLSVEYWTNQHLLSNDSCSGCEFESHFELIMPSWSPKTGVNIDILMDTAILQSWKRSHLNSLWAKAIFKDLADQSCQICMLIILLKCLQATIKERTMYMAGHAQTSGQNLMQFFIWTFPLYCNLKNRSRSSKLLWQSKAPWRLSSCND